MVWAEGVWARHWRPVRTFCPPLKDVLSLETSPDLSSASDNKNFLSTAVSGGSRGFALEACNSL